MARVFVLLEAFNRKEAAALGFSLVQQPTFCHRSNKSPPASGRGLCKHDLISLEAQRVSCFFFFSRASRQTAARLTSAMPATGSSGKLSEVWGISPLLAGTAALLSAAPAGLAVPLAAAVPSVLPAAVHLHCAGKRGPSPAAYLSVAGRTRLCPCGRGRGPSHQDLPRHAADHSNGAADRHAAPDPARAGDGRADCKRPAGGRLLLAAAQIPAGGAFDPRRKHPDADPDRQPRQPLRQAPGALRAGYIKNGAAFSERSLRATPHNSRLTAKTKWTHPTSFRLCPPAPQKVVFVYWHLKEGLLYSFIEYHEGAIS